MKIVFMGSADFGLPALKLLERSHTICGIVSTPAKQQGRGLKMVDSPVSVYARSNLSCPVLTPDNLKDPALPDELRKLEADIFVVVAFRILPRQIFVLPEFGTVNIHASLLPKYRGPAPIHRAIEQGESETGVTIFRIDEGVDTGEIIVQKSCSIGQQTTTPELYEQLSELGATALIEALTLMDDGHANALPQNSGSFSKAPKLSKEEGRIKWDADALSIFNKIRAFKPFPGTYTFLEDKRMHIDWAEPIPDHNCLLASGMISQVTESFFDVQCKTGALRVVQIKPEGRKSISVHDYLLGHHLSKGIQFT